MNYALTEKALCTLIRTLKNTINNINIPVMESGFIGTTSVTSGTFVDIPITFETPFQSAPKVFLELKSTSSSADIGSMTVALASDVDKTGCIIRIFNNSESTRAPGVFWTALSMERMEDMAGVTVNWNKDGDVIVNGLVATHENHNVTIENVGVTYNDGDVTIIT